MAQIAQETWNRAAALLSVWAWLIQAVSPHITPHTTMYQRRVRAAWRALRGLEAHHGAALLLVGEDSVRGQERIAQALGGMDRAIFVQKLHEWIEFNKSEGREATTYNAYTEWIETHFGWMNEACLGRHVRALEAMGVLITQPVGKRDQRKVYRIDYGRLNVLVSMVKTTNSAMKSKESSVKSRESSAQKSNSKTKTQDSNLNHDSKSPTQSPNQSLKPNAGTNASTQEPPTKPTGRGGWRPGAGRKKKEAGTATAAATGVPGEIPSVSAIIEANDSAAQIEDSSSPNSATPPSHPEAELIERMADLGLDQDRAAVLIDEHSADRVRAVVRKCEQRLKPDSREQKIENPAGWIIRELQNDVFKLGSLTDDDELALPENLWKRLSDYCLSDEEIEAAAADDATGAPILVVTSEPASESESVPNEETVVITPSPVSVAASTWDRAMGVLPQYCGNSQTRIIRDRVSFVGYEADIARFVVRAGDDHAHDVLKQRAGTLKAILSRLMGQPCRIKDEGEYGDS